MIPKTILLVEDNPSDIELTRRALKRANINNELVVAEDGLEALDLLFRTGIHAGRSPYAMPALIFLDIKLPGIDGIEVLKRLRENPLTHRQPVVVMTSSIDEHDVAAVYDLGVNSYIRKPVDFLQFCSVLRQVCTYWLELNHPAPE